MKTVPLPQVEMDACWNRIGVAGDQSCPKLERHVHCRNCEVYAGAAQRNLRRPVDAAYRADWAAQLRAPEAVAAAAAHSALVFRVGREWLALPTAVVLSVAPAAPAHTLPHRSGRGLDGIVNVGGKLAPSMSLPVLLGIDSQASQAEAGRHAYARLLVIEWEGQPFAMAVADLHGIIRYGDAAVRAPAATIGKGLQRFLTGVVTEAGLHIGLLDAALLGHQCTRLLR
jgi:chemotaxis-related protein WspD